MDCSPCQKKKQLRQAAQQITKKTTKPGAKPIVFVTKPNK